MSSNNRPLPFAGCEPDRHPRQEAVSVKRRFGPPEPGVCGCSDTAFLEPPRMGSSQSSRETTRRTRKRLGIRAPILRSLSHRERTEARPARYL